MDVEPERVALQVTASPSGSVTVKVTVEEPVPDGITSGLARRPVMTGGALSGAKDAAMVWSAWTLVKV